MSLLMQKYIEFIAVGVNFKFISSHKASEHKTQYAGLKDPDTICHGASRSSSTFLDQFNLVFEHLETCCILVVSTFESKRFFLSSIRCSFLMHALLVLDDNFAGKKEENKVFVFLPIALRSLQKRSC
jgi:hypothetical protein